MAFAPLSRLRSMGVAVFCSAILVASATAGEPLRVMSFNVRGDFDGGVATDKPNGWLSKSGDHRRDLALRVVSEADPDLLGVQEAYANQVRELDDALPGHDVYAIGRDDGREAGEHCAIYYRRDRFERAAAGTFWLSETPDEPSTYPGAACPRIASWVLLSDDQNGGRELLLVNTHWDHVSAEARTHSGGLIHGRITRFMPGLPAIVVGDMNAGEESEPIRALLGAGDNRLLDSFREVFAERGPNEATYHGFQGGEEGGRIDYVLHTTDFTPTAAAIARTAAGERHPSDHYPVTATLELVERPHGPRASN